jgi:hypothetical protein
MTFSSESLFGSVAEALRNVGFMLRAACSTPLGSEGERSDESRTVSDFEGWLHRAPTVIGDPANRYTDSSPGYLTRNGLGSLEVGAADD